MHPSIDVLIVERDDLIAEVLADALADVGIDAKATPSEEQALNACHDSEPRVVITGMNRSDEDMKGLQFGRAMRDRCPGLSVVYLAALWPSKLKGNALDSHERFLPKPVRMGQLVNTVIELLPA